MARIFTEGSAVNLVFILFCGYCYFRSSKQKDQNGIAGMEYKFNSQIRPSGFPHDFDAHIYFDEPTLPIARNLKAQVELIFSQQIQEGSLFVGHLITRSVGPHPLPMFEINFSKSLFGTFVPWLMQNRKNLDALVHSISKDDLYDHTQGAVWLGRQLPLDFSKF